MLMRLLGDQDQVNLQHPMPTDDVSASSSISTISSETVQLQYYNSGTLTNDAGEAAGSAVVGTLANKNVLNELGTQGGTFNDTSLSFTSTALTTEVKMPFEALEVKRFDSPTNKLDAIVADFANGEYAVDYRTGAIYGKKASTTTTLTSTTYKINVAQSGTTGGVATSVEAEGDVAHDAVDSGNPVKVGGKAGDPTSLPADVAALDRVDAAMDLKGRLITYPGVQLAGEDLTNDRLGVVHRPVVTSTDAPTLFTDFGANATANVKASAGNVLSVSCQNENAADRYLQLHNTATTPSVSAVPLYTFEVGPSTQIVIGSDFFTSAGAHFTTGIAFAFSTTKDTYTAGTAGEQTTLIHYV